MNGKRRILISSVQKELAAGRGGRWRTTSMAIPSLRRFFGVFLSRTCPPRAAVPTPSISKEVDRCDIYLGLLGDQYGYEDAAGLSPTEREFDRATAAGKERLLFVKGDTDSARHPKMQALVRKAGGQLIRRRFASIPDLTAAVYASLVDYLGERGCDPESAVRRTERHCRTVG